MTALVLVDLVMAQVARAGVSEWCRGEDVDKRLTAGTQGVNPWWKK
jgi:hypothetical protein